MVTTELLLSEYHNCLKSGYRPNKLYLMTPDGSTFVEWTISNSKAVKALDTEALTAECQDGWSLTFNPSSDVFYTGQ